MQLKDELFYANQFISRLISSLEIQDVLILDLRPEANSNAMQGLANLDNKIRHLNDIIANQADTASLELPGSPTTDGSTQFQDIYVPETSENIQTQTHLSVAHNSC